MGRVFLPQSQATPYTPKVGETFNDVVAKCDKASPAITAEEVAQFNWGAQSDSEVLRALVELVGCQEINDLDPYDCKLNPKNGLKGKILLPKVWKKSGLAYEKVHKLTVKKSLPATAIGITGLDAWFLPGEETCGIFYQLEGIKERAQILDFDVYASNYCKATAQVNGDLVDYTYSDTPDVPILQHSLSTGAIQRESGEVEDWKGESEAASGVLAKRSDGARYINAASSPYTVVLRYSKSAAKTAFINLNSFWPRWSGEGANRSLAADSLKVKWTAKNCPGGLQGQIQLFDKDKIVWRQYLPAAKCGNGNQDFDLPAEAKSKIEEDFMPYRVQIQLHTDKDTDDGFAIAAMHSEVRLFTHPEIGTFGDDHEKEPQVLPLALAPYYAGPAPPDDSAKGRKLRLAKAGYHPGPVADGEGQAPYLQAVKEFQRDHTKPGSKERLKADGTLDGPTKSAITALAPDRRPLFADHGRQNLTDNGKIANALNDLEIPFIVWLDDRHNYTEVDATSQKVLLTNMGLENYRGPMDGVDVKQAKDDASICRPWIPLQVTIPVLRKSDSLSGSSIPVVTEASRAATGPIRVDWTFRDLAVEYNIDTTDYTVTRTRPHKHLEDDFNAIKGSHNGKDAWNCTTALGGLRGADYYKAPFGTDTDSLMPWKALADSGVSAVCSVAHDDLGQDKAQLFDTHLGTAGAYFHPSIIGGDGYQLRAQVSFRDLPSGSTHPNWKVLRDRYDVTKLAQVHSAPMRLWRKDTMRAYVLWAPKDECHWDENGSRNTVFIKYYEPGMVHFEYEGGVAPNVPLATVLTKDDYVKTLSDTITGTMGTDVTTDTFRPKSEWQFDPEHLWPWVKAKHMGINAVPDPTVTVDQYEPGFLDAKIWDISWYQYSAPLIHLLLAHVEQKKGAMRGHFITEFLSSPTFWKETYTCSQCATHEILIELTAAGGTGVGEPCRTPACTGTLQSSVTETYTCDVCGFSKTASVSENLEGTACTKPCGGTLSMVSTAPGTSAGMNSTVYQCSVCGRKITVTEATASAGSRAGTVCGQSCTGHMRGDPSTRTAQLIQETTFGSLTFPAIGEALGALWIMTDGGSGGPRTFWAHEVGHHKHLEHAGATAQGSKPAQHDSTNNTVDAKLLAHPPQAGDGNWDRTCIMSYTSAESVTRLDAGYFCGKCILKLRGWKVEGLANPAAGVQGP